MKMICSRCSGTFENQLVCPKCRRKLTYPNKGPLDRDALVAFAQSDAYPSLPSADASPTGARHGWKFWLGLLVLAVAAVGGVALAAWLWQS